MPINDDIDRVRKIDPRTQPDRAPADETEQAAIALEFALRRKDATPVPAPTTMPAPPAIYQ